MLSYIVRRILYSIPVLLVASFLVFAGVRATFDPTARLRTSRDASTIERERERLGLDDPLIVQYGNWLGGAVTGDLGEGEVSGEEVTTAIRRALGRTLQIIGWGVAVTATLAIGIGVFSAVRQYSLPDYIFTGLSYLGIAMPPFWFGLIAINVFSFRLKGWLGWDEPPLYSLGLHSGDSSAIDLDYFRHLVLPVMTLSVQAIASWSRYQRAAMLDVLSSDYVRTARAKGLPRRKVIFRHAFRNALIPLVTVMALDIGGLFGGLIVTERIFGIAGMGSLFFDRLFAGDAYMVMGWFLVVAVMILLFNLIADILYGVLDPRIRLS